MIAYLSGKIVSKADRSAVIDVNGVGYLVFVTRGVAEKLQIGEPVILHIHTHVREDAISLYGFPEPEQLQFFELLLGVSGVGPKSALEILNSSVSKVRQSIAQKETAYLTQIQGIGKKTAERIIVDLQGKIKEEIMVEESEGKVSNDDIVQALVALGYHRQQVLAGLKKVPGHIDGEEAIIKYFLQNI